MLHFVGPRVFDKNVNQGLGYRDQWRHRYAGHFMHLRGSGRGAAGKQHQQRYRLERLSDPRLGAGRAVLERREQHPEHQLQSTRSERRRPGHVARHLHPFRGQQRFGSGMQLLGGCGTDGIQLYGQSGGTTISNILISGNQFSDNAQDIAVETAGPAISGITITGNSFSRTHGNAVTLKEGSGIHVDSNQFYDMANGAVVLGNWAPYDAGASLSGVTVNNNTYQISSGTAGRIFVATGANGSLSNVSFQGNTASGFHEVGTYQMGAIQIDHVSGATVSGNTLTMASGAGSGIRAPVCGPRTRRECRSPATR